MGMATPQSSFVGGSDKPEDDRQADNSNNSGKNQVAPRVVGQTAVKGAIQQKPEETIKECCQGQSSRHIISGSLFKANLTDEIAHDAGKAGIGHRVDDHADGADV